MLVSFGLIALLILAFPQRHRRAVWIGMGSVIGIAAQNSMGPLSFGGVLELAYLLQEILFLVIAGIVGIEMSFFWFNQQRSASHSELGNISVE